MRTDVSHVVLQSLAVGLCGWFGCPRFLQAERLGLDSEECFYGGDKSLMVISMRLVRIAQVRHRDESFGKSDGWAGERLVHCGDGVVEKLRELCAQ